MNERAWMFLILCKLSYTDISSGIFFLCLVAEGESLHLNISLGGGGGLCARYGRRAGLKIK